MLGIFFKLSHYLKCNQGIIKGPQSKKLDIVLSGTFSSIDCLFFLPVAKFKLIWKRG